MIENCKAEAVYCPQVRTYRRIPLLLEKYILKIHKIPVSIDMETSNKTEADRKVREEANSGNKISKIRGLLAHCRERPILACGTKVMEWTSV